MIATANATENDNDTPIQHRTGRISRIALAKALRVAYATVDRWVRVGVNGIKLPCHYIGGRKWFEWSEYQEWQGRVKETILPTPPAAASQGASGTRRGTSDEAKEILEKNGYTPPTPKA